MKYFSLLFFTIFLSCNSDSKRVVETEKETAECLIGKWVPENADQQPYNTYEFTADINNDRAEHRRFTVKGVDNKGNEREADGDWDIKSVGEVRANLGGASGISIKLTNCNRFVARGKTVYIKQ